MSDSKNGCHLGVILSPRAKATAVIGLHGEDLKIKIAAPPANGAANQALLKYLAELLKLGPADLSLIAGQTGRRKIIKIEGLNSEEMWNRLNIRLNAKTKGEGT